MRQELHLSLIKGNIDAVGLKIVGETETINFVRIYRRSGGVWREIVKDLNRGEGICIVGDFNAHHTLWNCDLIDPNGARSLEEFDDENLFYR